VAVLALLVALGPSTGFYAKLVAGRAAHVCHCEVRGGHATCACPICFPELRGDDDGDVATMKGVCGDDDPVVRAASYPAVALTPSSFVPAVDWEIASSFAPPHALRPRSKEPPDPRPPRAIG
jgi:hypothetical protein